MDIFLDLYNLLLTNYGLWSIVVLVLLTLCLLVQLYYYVGCYGRIPMFRPSEKNPREVDGLSVVVVVNENEYFISELLPLLLSQHYDNFEVLVVDLLHNDEYSQSLKTIAEHNPRLRVCSISQKDERYQISNKMALNIGIKESSYENIILTTVNVKPKNEKWLASMAKGFSRGEVVICYCGGEQLKGFNNKFIRCARLFCGMKYLASSVANKTYRGDINCLGFTKNTYFKASGFNYLNLRMGEDDLFVQSIATKDNTTQVMNSSTGVVQKQLGGVRWYNAEKLFFSSTFRFYPVGVRSYVRIELLSRVLFLICFVVVVSLLPLVFKIFAGVLLLLRLIIVGFEVSRISKRLGEKGLVMMYLIYDIISIFGEARLSLLRIIKQPKGVWR